MSLAEIVRCAPWRLSAPRALSNYEWYVVERAISEGIAASAPLLGPGILALAKELTLAISQQRFCPSWTQSYFGPPPAVATFAYGCLGSWFGTLDPVTQQSVVAQIRSGPFLCSAIGAWKGACPIQQKSLLWRPANRSEYAAQLSNLPPGAPISDACAYVRMRTVYAPMTGAEMQRALGFLYGGSLPLALQSIMAAGGTLLAKRSLLVAIQLKAQIDPRVVASADPQTLARAALDDVAIIWAPGQGMSIRDEVLSGKIDPTRLAPLLTAVLPGAVGDLLKQIPGLANALPGLTTPGAQGWANVLGTVLGSGMQSQPSQLVQGPFTPPTTGYAVVDLPRTKQLTTPPPGVANEASVEGIGGAAALFIVLGTIGLLVGLSKLRHP